MFGEVAAQCPLATAVLVAGGGSLTYAELDRRANRLAHLLQSHGVTADVPVAIACARSLELAVCVLGVLKAGGAYVPLDVQYPAERLAYMLENSRAPIVLGQGALIDGLAPAGATVMAIERLEDRLAAQPETAPVSTVTAASLAYVIYTSGSTGQPKGVAMVQGALANLIAWQLARSPVGAGERTLQFAPISFDVSFQELFATWCAGGTVVMVDEETRRDFRALLEVVERERVARLFLPFVALHQLAETAMAGAGMPSSLREIITAGEQLQITPAIASFFRQRPGCLLENQYGPSETHVVTAHRLQGPPDAWPALPPIGHPIDGVEARVLDDERRPVVEGGEGELYIGGVALARGYLHRPELTTERFVADPQASDPAARLYRTGDLVRWLPDGALEFLGRKDAQVKIRGYRVELGEIEGALRGHGAVRDAAVAMREDVPGDKRLVAYVVAREGAPAASALREFLQGRLPDYMVPSAFVVLPAFPLTPSGKVDRRALPAPDRSRPELATPYVEPRSAVERAVAAVWCEVLRVDRVGVDDNFFELGGNSLLAMPLMIRLQPQGALPLPVVRLFEYPTVRALAGYLTAGAGGGGGAVDTDARAKRQRAALFGRRPAGNA
jgi:amino acid adenylation domain-containing protein